MTEVSKLAIAHTLAALKEIDIIESKANNIGITLDIHDDLHSLLIGALNELLPDLGGNFTEFSYFTADQLLQLNDDHDRIKSIGFTGRCIFIKYDDGKEWIIDNREESE